MATLDELISTIREAILTCRQIQTIAKAFAEASEEAWTESALDSFMEQRGKLFDKLKRLDVEIERIDSSFPSDDRWPEELRRLIGEQLNTIQSICDYDRRIALRVRALKQKTAEELEQIHSYRKACCEYGRAASPPPRFCNTRA